MGRPAFQLTDAQGRALVAELGAILIRHPAGSNSHRPFLREFLRAVFTATGKTYSPEIYRRLMSAYAPGRNPSSSTIADEKRALDEALAEEATAGRQIEPQGGEELAAVIRRAVQDSFVQPAGIAVPSHQNLLAEAQRDFLQDRLASTESQLADARSLAARLAADLQTAKAEAQNFKSQLEKETGRADRQELQLKALTESVDSMRKFSMSAIDGVRGETRAWQERCAALEAKLQEEKKHLEYFRQIAYQRGAPVPDNLKGTGS